MKKIVFVFMLLAFVSALFAGEIATVHSDYCSYWYKGKFDKTIETLGYDHVSIENKDFKNYSANLKDYSMIIFERHFNSSNKIDFNLYKNELLDYVKSGGKIIFTDTWTKDNSKLIHDIFGITFESSAPGPYFAEEAYMVAQHHPILEGISKLYLNDYKSTKVKDAVTLTSDPEGNPSIVYKEIGDGLVVVSNTGYKQGFPGSDFVYNCINYYSSVPEKKVLEDYPIHSKRVYDCALNCIRGNDSIETAFAAYYENKCISFCFMCFDPDLTGIGADYKGSERDKNVWTDDSVEIFLKNPKGSVYHFATNTNVSVLDEKDGDRSFDTMWDRNIYREDGMWVALITIPLNALDIEYTDNPVFYFNVLRNYHPGTDESALYSLAPDIYEENWGRLTFADQIDLTGYKKLDLRVPKDLYVGEALCTVSNSDKFCIVDMAEDTLFDSDGKECTVTFTKPGEHFLMSADLDFNLSDPIKVNVKDPFKVKVLYPNYRDIVQSMDPDKTLRVDYNVEGYNAEDCSLLYTIKKGEEAIENGSAPGQGQVHYDLSGLEPGDYSYKLELYYGEDLLRTFERSFKILPPAPFEVTFDYKRICYVNGKAFLPICLYHCGNLHMNDLNNSRKEGVPEITLEELNRDAKDHGFNVAITITSTPMNDIEPEAALKEGLIFNSETGVVLDREALKAQVEQNNKHKTGLFYYTVDEPLFERLDNAKEMYGILKEIDPHRPVGAAINYPNVFREAGEAFDILMPDPYPFVFGNLTPSLNDMLPSIESAFENTNYEKPLWAVPQAFGWGEGVVRFNTPTYKDIRAQMYYFLVHGATGFAWYAYESPEFDGTQPYNRWCIKTAPWWDDFKTLNREAQDLFPIIAEGEDMGELKGNNDKVHSHVWNYKGKNYVIIINPEQKKHTVTYNINEPRNLFAYDEVLWVKEGNKTKFTLKPFDVAIVEF